MCPLIKEEVRRMEEISQQTIFLCENQIDTYEQLKEKQAEMDDLISQRKKLTNKMRRAAFDEKETLSQQKKGLSDQISVLRKDLKWSLDVEKRSLDMVDRIIILFKKLDRIAKKRVQMSSLFY